MPGFTSITGEESIMFADNASFNGTDRGGAMTADGQLWIGHAAGSPFVGLGVLTSPLGTLSIGYSYPNITLDSVGGMPITNIDVDIATDIGVNPVVPPYIDPGSISMLGGGAFINSGWFTVIRTNAVAPGAMIIEVQQATLTDSFDNASCGVSCFNRNNFSIDTFNQAFVTPTNVSYIYTNVTNGMSPYTVNVYGVSNFDPSDQYISVDCSGGPVTLLFPDVPVNTTPWTVKDRTGNALVNNITITTVSGARTFDGSASYTINTNYGSVQFLANSSHNYELF